MSNDRPDKLTAKNFAYEQPGVIEISWCRSDVPWAETGTSEYGPWYRWDVKLVEGADYKHGKRAFFPSSLLQGTLLALHEKCPLSIHSRIRIIKRDNEGKVAWDTATYDGDKNVIGATSGEAKRLDDEPPVGFGAAETKNAGPSQADYRAHLANCLTWARAVFADDFFSSEDVRAIGISEYIQECRAGLVPERQEPEEVREDTAEFDVPF